jgi:hypothetical protein
MAQIAMLTGFLFEAFDWKSLEQDALVVDVGGGVGSSTLELFKAYPHLRYVVQDRPTVNAHAIKVRLPIKRNNFYACIIIHLAA